MAIHQAAKANDLTAALTAFDQAKADGLKMGTDLYVSLLYLCGGGDAWEATLQQLYGGGDAQAGAAAAEAAPATAAEQPEPAAARPQPVAAPPAAEAELPVPGVDVGAAEAAAEPSAPRQPQPSGEERAQRASELFEEMKVGGARGGVVVGQYPASVVHVCLIKAREGGARRGHGSTPRKYVCCDRRCLPARPLCATW